MKYDLGFLKINLSFVFILQDYEIVKQDFVKTTVL